MRFARALLFLLLALDAGLHLPAQTSPRPHKDPALPLRQFEQFAVFWTTEAGWNTELHLRNNLHGQDEQLLRLH